MGRSICCCRARDQGLVMRFSATPIAGAFLIELELIEDERGFFARTFCREEFIAHGLNPELVQCNISFNKRRGTLRGLHFQSKPHEEAKLVRCTQGNIYDVILDLRSESPSYLSWFGTELSSTQKNALYIPEGIAHGFQTLTEETEVFYQMSESYHPESARGLRWNDPAFKIRWPLTDPVMSERDKSYALWGDQ